MSHTYADIVVPLALNALTFALTESLGDSMMVGVRVVVQVNRKYYTGIVWRLHNNKPPYKTKEVESVVSNGICLLPKQMELFEWISSYYMTPLGLVLKAAMPSLLKGNGYDLDELSSRRLRKQVVRHVVLHSSIDSEQALLQRLQELSRSKKQQQSVAEYINKCGIAVDFAAPQPIPLSEMSASRAVIKGLEQREIFSLVDVEVEPTLDALPAASMLPHLSDVQSEALEQIDRGFEQSSTVLLHGVTGSGKTEIYIHLISRALEMGGNALLMIPEIALTAQLIERLQRYFGNRVVAYHSKYSDRQRAELFSRLVEPSQQGLLIVGVRSSILLPLQNLGVIIVDEEHDTSYKQSDKAPSYNARDTALVLASKLASKSLLGSATPSLESYYNAKSGKYALVTIESRYSGVEMPEIKVSDSRLASRRGERRDHINLMLKNRIEQALEAEEQVMLFQNRRGFSPYVECGGCAHVPTCPDCSVSLTYHKSDNSLKCHYCGYTMSLPERCPECGVLQSFQMQGFGTQKIEQVLEEMFPDAKIARMDTDITRAVGRLNRTIESFRSGEVDILVGTQMITKGFDFGGVRVVGILNADNMLHYPDFRASERAFQTMTQVAGRAGRRESRGEVIIQTSDPQNLTIEAVCSGDYVGLAESQLSERKAFLYPPFSRMIKITLAARDRAVLWGAAELFAANLRAIFGRRMLGPEAPPVERLMGNYNAVITVKIERSRSFERAKELIVKAASDGAKKLKGVAIYFDVDPI